jgi:hypothetical protein
MVATPQTSFVWLVGFHHLFDFIGSRFSIIE